MGGGKQGGKGVRGEGRNKKEHRLSHSVKNVGIVNIMGPRPTVNKTNGGRNRDLKFDYRSQGL